MIPRFYPDFGLGEIFAFLHFEKDSVEKFENEFCTKFLIENAIAFPYGRSALWAFLQSLMIKGKEIVLPAYTCSVVSHAIVCSGNKPIFVDINLTDFNMNLEKFAEAVNNQTAAVIPTHLFGNPMNVLEVERIVKEKEKKIGKKIWVIQDCAHSFGARWEGKSVIQFGDASLFGLGVSKVISSIFGGMMTIRSKDLAERLRTFRNENFQKPHFLKPIKELIYLIAFSIAFQEEFYGITNYLEQKTRILDRLSKAYHQDGKIHLPPDFMDTLMKCNARVGSFQLQKYDEAIQRRQEIFNIYLRNLIVKKNWTLPQTIEGATHSHFPVLIENKNEVIRTLAKKGIHIGEVINYCLPYTQPYQNHLQNERFPNSLFCSNSIINIPIYPHLSDEQVYFIIQKINTLEY